jgi:hypothetical protein
MHRVTAAALIIWQQDEGLHFGMTHLQILYAASPHSRLEAVNAGSRLI